MIRMQTQHSLDYSEAKKIVDAIVARAQSLQKAVVVAVADPHGDLIAFARMDGVGLPSMQIAMNKAWTAARHCKPTKDIGDRLQKDGFDIAYYGDARVVGWGGGIPVRKDGEVIGAIGVSGLSSEEDVELAEIGAKLIENKA
ncbi:MAG TPA: heme-binding protein [Candidatus Kapabacteria bacterium]|nr:heme-binding protein [Candidatus Kapabacteria bacterium]